MTHKAHAASLSRTRNVAVVTTDARRPAPTRAGARSRPRAVGRGTPLGERAVMEERYVRKRHADVTGPPDRAGEESAMSGSVTHVDFQSRKVRKRAERTAGGWPVLVAKPLRPAEADQAAPPTDEHMETAV